MARELPWEGVSPLVWQGGAALLANLPQKHLVCKTQRLPGIGWVAFQHSQRNAAGYAYRIMAWHGCGALLCRVPLKQKKKPTCSSCAETKVAWAIFTCQKSVQKPFLGSYNILDYETAKGERVQPKHLG